MRFLGLLVASLAVFASQVEAEICHSNCEYNFVIATKRTMTYSNPDGYHEDYNVEIDKDTGDLKAMPNGKMGGTLMKQNADIVNRQISPDDVITGNGWHRNIITVNGQYPGPTIEVMEGADIILHVTNDMPSEITSLHFHGIYQQGTPYMDGATLTSQCPITPKMTFTYRFKAYPHGTKWYHTHVYMQRIEGLYGPIIIHKTDPPATPYFIAQISDYYQQWSIMYGKMHELTHKDLNHLTVNDPYTSKTVDNNVIVLGGYQSGVINGKGEFQGNHAPLTTYKVTKGGKFRFRFLNTGVAFFYTMSIDNHDLTVVSMDGYDVKPFVVKYVNLYPGEMADVEITADQNVAGYFVRGNNMQMDTLKVSSGGIVENVVLAKMVYDGADVNARPSSSDHTCTADAPCKVVNCPFYNFGSKYNKQCVNLNDISSDGSYDLSKYGIGSGPDDFDEEIFINLGLVPKGQPSINARLFKYPTSHLFKKNWEDYITKCDEDKCNSEGCTCTHVIDIPMNKNIQLVVSNYPSSTTSIAVSHPFHLHGNGFAVVEQDYKPGDPESGYHSWAGGFASNKIYCKDASTQPCTKPTWAAGVTHNYKIDNPILKSVAVVPAGGHLVIRFRSDSPGWWPIHCHQSVHSSFGMTALLKVGNFEDWPTLPQDFPDCASSQNLPASKKRGVDEEKKNCRAERDNISSLNDMNVRLVTDKEAAKEELKKCVAEKSNLQNNLYSKSAAAAQERKREMQTLKDLLASAKK